MTAQCLVNLAGAYATSSFILEEARSEHGKVALQFLDHHPQVCSENGIWKWALGG